MLHAEVFIHPAFYLTTPTFAFNTLKTQYPEQEKKISNFLVKHVQRHFLCVCFLFVLPDTQLIPFGKLSNAWKATQQQLAPHYFAWDIKTYALTF